MMDHDNLDFVQAVEELAKAAGMEIPAKKADGRTNRGSRPIRRSTHYSPPPPTFTVRH